jgi:ElaB/YqjD/DUF883 family membrane-anchored ribosome-binding protein
MPSRRVATTLAAALLAALGACSKEAGNNAQTKPSVGAKIDNAIERTQQKLSTAGEKAKEDVQQAAEKTQDALSKAGDKLSNGTANAVSDAKQALQPGSPPYAPRQPVAPSGDAGSGAAAPNAAQQPPATTTTTLSTGPTTTVNITTGGGR